MPVITRNQRALAGEPLADGDITVTFDAEHSPRTQARLDAAHDAELLRVDADRQYNECLLDAPVVVYGSGKGCVAVVPVSPLCGGI